MAGLLLAKDPVKLEVIDCLLNLAALPEGIKANKDGLVNNKDLPKELQISASCGTPDLSDQLRSVQNEVHMMKDGAAEVGREKEVEVTRIFPYPAIQKYCDRIVGLEDHKIFTGKDLVHKAQTEPSNNWNRLCMAIFTLIFGKASDKEAEEKKEDAEKPNSLSVVSTGK